MEDFSKIPAVFPMGSDVRVAGTGRLYKVAGYTIKNGLVCGRMVTVANADGVQFSYSTSKLEAVAR